MTVGAHNRPQPVEQSDRVAGFVDVETTGLDPSSDEVVELALALVAYDPQTGNIVRILEEYVGLRDPGVPIPVEASRLHGIRSSDVRGRMLDDDRVRSMLERADFLVAHNAEFDKAFLSKLYPEVLRKRWVCSMRSIPWKQMGYRSRSLHSLLDAHRIRVRRAHRGLDDVRALVALLSCSHGNGQSYFSILARKASTRTRRPPSRRPERATIASVAPSPRERRETVRPDHLLPGPQPAGGLWQLLQSLFTPWLWPGGPQGRR